MSRSSSSPGHYFAMSSQFEPEGLYLALPLEGESRLLQGWGAHSAFYGGYTYNGVRLKGHIGLDLAAPAGAPVLAADAGRITEINVEPGGFGRYIKIEHSWGESFYAHIVSPVVDAGQSVKRGQHIAQVEAGRRRSAGAFPAHLHFAVRINPYNRFDGWGGFSDPLPYLYAPTLDVAVPQTGAEDETPGYEEGLPPMLAERPGMRRP